MIESELNCRPITTMMDTRYMIDLRLFFRRVYRSLYWFSSTSFVTNTTTTTKWDVSVRSYLNCCFHVELQVRQQNASSYFHISMRFYFSLCIVQNLINWPLIGSIIGLAALFVLTLGSCVCWYYLRFVILKLNFLT